MCKTKRIHYLCEGGIENLSLVITTCHHSASLVMPIGDPRDGFFYPTLTFMRDSYVKIWETYCLHVCLILYQVYVCKILSSCFVMHHSGQNAKRKIFGA